MGRPSGLSDALPQRPAALGSVGCNPTEANRRLVRSAANWLEIAVFHNYSADGILDLELGCIDASSLRLHNSRGQSGSLTSAGQRSARSAFVESKEIV